MSGAHVHWRRCGITPKLWCHCHLKVRLLTVVGTIWLLLALHHQLSEWDGIPELQEQSPKVPANEIAAYTKRWLEFGYNAWLAERIPLRRELPNVRDRRCLNISDPVGNMVAVVVIFRNAQLSMLLRMLHSFRDNTNMNLVWEMILINDHSDVGIWQEELSRRAFDEYVKHYIYKTPKIYHMEEQMGLVRARRFGALESESDYLVFLDAHAEFTEGWLEPLMAEVINDRYALAYPQLDVLDEQTLDYVTTVERRGLFDWSLRRREVPLLWQQQKELPRPFATPVLRTPVFVIEADWFNNLAHFDMDVNSPAAAELELSFLVWRLEGRILQVPCSRVGLLQPHDRSYLQLYGNLNQMALEHFSSYKRLVEIWLDDPKYKSVVYQYQPQIQQAHMRNISKNERTFDGSKFKSFDWYLEYVAPDLLQHFPLMPRIDFANGTLRPAQLPHHCLTGSSITRHITLELCSSALQAAQSWTLSYMNDLRLGDNYCLEVQPNQMEALNLCNSLGGPQSWHMNMGSNCLVSNRHCLEFDSRKHLIMTTCNFMNVQQMWFFEHINLEALESIKLYDK